MPAEKLKWTPDDEFDLFYQELGRDIYEFASRIFPLPRSISGNGVRETLAVVADILPELQIHEIATGERCFDWVVPPEWNVRDAYIADLDGNRVVDWNDNNLHLVGYSEPINLEVDRSDLENHLHSIPELPDAIPYVTSYYKKTWGFCVSQRQRSQLRDRRYRAVIDSELKDGHLTFADLILPGESKKEVLLSTYTCHPSMANNEVSGIALATFLGRELCRRKRKLTYRIVFVPETIGAVIYLSRHLQELKDRLISGFVLTCVGDDRAINFMPSRRGDTIADRIARDILNRFAPGHQELNFLQNRGSDERQYCSPGVDLPVVSLMRSAYGRYPEYHTSLDNLDVICADGFAKSAYLHLKMFDELETTKIWQATNMGEPQLSRHNLRDHIGGQRVSLNENQKLISDVLALADGKTDTVMMARAMERSREDIERCCQQLANAKLLRSVH